MVTLIHVSTGSMISMILMLMSADREQTMGNATVVRTFSERDGYASVDYGIGVPKICEQRTSKPTYLEGTWGNTCAIIAAQIIMPFRRYRKLNSPAPSRLEEMCEQPAILRR
jgi:hypothetical protein